MRNLSLTFLCALEFSVSPEESMVPFQAAALVVLLGALLLAIKCGLNLIDRKRRD
jgi:hypothetical protein